MTCIVGIETPRGVMLAGDSLGAGQQWDAAERSDPKVFAVGPYVFGFTSSFRMGDILRYHVDLPAPGSRGLRKHLVTKVIPVIREAFKSHGFGTTKDGGEVGGAFLVGVRGELYQVESDYQVGRRADGYDAVGCGAQIALGALYACLDRRRPKVCLTRALEAAERFSIGVRGPWRFVKERA